MHVPASVCAELCPNGVFELDGAKGKMKLSHRENCVVLCDKCTASSPGAAIRFPEKAQIKDLVKRLLKKEIEPVRQ